MHPETVSNMHTSSTRSLIPIALFSFFLLLQAPLTKACGNEYGYSLDGKRMYTRFLYLTDRQLAHDTTRVRKRLSEARAKVNAGTADFKTWSNIALYLMKLGKADSSVQILAPLVLKHSDEYSLHANLGTAYELTGRLDSALKYIRKGFEINPRSHGGSEWIHVAILQAKIEEKRRPGTLKTKSILSEELLASKLGTGRNPVRNLNRHLVLQIRTRAPFTPAPNLVLANLCKSFASLNEQHGTYENALLGYVYAMRFQPSAYLKRQLEHKISRLNEKRQAMGNVHELSDIFLHMMKRAKIDPEILLMGMDDIASAMAAVDEMEWAKQDSLDAARAALDSLQAAHVAQATTNSDQLATLQAAGTRRGWWMLGIGLLGGAILVLAGRLIFRRKVADEVSGSGI